MDVDNIYKSSLPENGIIVMGNEANGISKELEAIVTSHRLVTTFRICSNDRV
jgi:TrmH family RNA methyltransferase